MVCIYNSSSGVVWYRLGSTAVLEGGGGGGGGDSRGEHVQGQCQEGAHGASKQTLVDATCQDAAEEWGQSGKQRKHKTQVNTSWFPSGGALLRRVGGSYVYIKGHAVCLRAVQTARRFNKNTHQNKHHIYVNSDPVLCKW